jgi:hypothetical protein
MVKILGKQIDDDQQSKGRMDIYTNSEESALQWLFIGVKRPEVFFAS